ncbi:MAG: HDIG domain-containing protein, partial [Acidimicrobiia bacterium]|nr:HDIG domain-containing protein [Acidimicrobiia bacterium]
MCAACRCRDRAPPAEQYENPLSLEQDPIHRHKDVLTHTFAVVENVRREMPGDFRIVRLAALYHDIGKPRTRKVLPGKGMTFYHH